MMLGRETRDRSKNRMHELIQAEQLDENGEVEVVPHTSAKRKRRSQRTKGKGKVKAIDDGLGSGDDGTDYSDTDEGETESSDLENGIEITNEEVPDLDNAVFILSNFDFSSRIVFHQRRSLTTHRHGMLTVYVG
jgi:hypothetical protein